MKGFLNMESYANIGAIQAKLYNSEDDIQKKTVAYLYQNLHLFLKL